MTQISIGTANIEVELKLTHGLTISRQRDGLPSRTSMRRAAAGKAARMCLRQRSAGADDRGCRVPVLHIYVSPDLCAVSAVCSEPLAGRMRFSRAYRISSILELGRPISTRPRSGTWAAVTSSLSDRSSVRAKSLNGRPSCAAHVRLHRDRVDPLRWRGWLPDGSLL